MRERQTTSGPDVRGSGARVGWGLSPRRFPGITAATGAAVGFIPLLRLLPAGAVPAALARTEPLRFFDYHPAAVVEEATARLIPGPADDRGDR